MGSSTHSTWALYVWDTSEASFRLALGPCTSLVGVQVATLLRRPYSTNQAGPGLVAASQDRGTQVLTSCQAGSSPESTGPLHSLPTHLPTSPLPTPSALAKHGRAWLTGRAPGACQRGGLTASQSLGFSVRSATFLIGGITATLCSDGAQGDPRLDRNPDFQPSPSEAGLGFSPGTQAQRPA